jgi:hypothetical protein
VDDQQRSSTKIESAQGSQSLAERDTTLISGTLYRYRA